MIKNLITYFQRPYLFAKTAIVLLLLALSFSCNDQGCIDADDFGEYESETVEVVANASASTCLFDASKPLDDDAQGSGLKLCLTTGDKSVTNESGITLTVDSSATVPGCLGFTDASYQYLCAADCVSKCQIAYMSNTGCSSDSTESECDVIYTSAQPAWTSTSKRSSSMNAGVTIMPGAEITVTASGRISLGDTAEYPSVYVQADEYLPHSKDVVWNDLFFDVRGDQSLNINFSGKWNNGEKNLGAGTATISASGNSATDVEIYNGGKRLAAYLILHPAGYDFDQSQTTEKAGAKAVTLLPDPSLWTCTYAADSSTGLARASCSAGDYVSAGYSNVSNASMATAFPINHALKTSTLSSHGGMIKWDNDGITADEYDPFASASCDMVNPCSGVSNIPATSGMILGATTTKITNPSNSSSTKYAYKVSFKNLNSGSTCNLNDGSFRIWVKDANGNILDEGAPSTGNDGSSRSININNSGWSTDNIVLEPGHEIHIDRSNITNPSCYGNAIAVKFSPYKDLEISQSGFVSFTMIGSGVSNGTCTLKARIINPDGSHSDDTFTTTGAAGGYSADFYEHDNFLSSSSTDPLASVGLTSNNWSTNVFVRKGQKIRISPESWNGQWQPSGINASCGTGMAMKITPRPALLCRGTKTDVVTNPSCTPEYDTTTGTLLGCQATALECFDETSSSFCPNSYCHYDVIDCVNADLASTHPYSKINCELSSTRPTCAEGSTTCAPCDTSDISAMTKCDACSNLKKSYALTAAKISVNAIDQCYDLENYTGKVANISNTSGFSDSDLADSTKAKGATKLGAFNGYYGNFDNLLSTDQVDSASGNNTIFTLSAPIIPSEDGRLRFFVLDGDSFTNTSTYSSNSIHGTSYTNSNGIKIALSGLLNFSNGQWMEAKLCSETSDTSVECRNLNASTYDPTGEDGKLLSIQPHLIDITTPTTAAEASAQPVITSPYKFDGSGNLVRIGANNGSSDCGSTIAGVYFYCHTFNYYSDSDLAEKTDNGRDRISDGIDKLRLTFRIVDPEIATCISKKDGTTNDGVISTNAYYDSTVSSNVGATCDPGASLGSTTNDCQKQYYCADKYSNNSGSYKVSVKVKNPSPSTVSNIISDVITPIIKVMDGDGKVRDCSTTGSASMDGVKTPNPLSDTSIESNVGGICLESETECKKQYYCKKATSTGQAERVYKALITDYRYKAIVNMCMIVMFTFYGVGFLMGVSELNHSEILNRLIKIGLIYLFIGETGWDWFNLIVVQFFKTSTDYLAFMMASSFDDSPNIQEAISNSDYYDKSVLFSSVDQVFNIFFSSAVQKKISALLFASIFGWLYMIIIYWGFWLYLLAVGNAVLLYLTAQVFISILFTLGPIFFLFTLFSQTKDMFDNWLKQLISFSLQQIFLLTTLAFFNMLMYEVIKLSLGYKICWEEVWSINIITHISLMSFWNIASLPPRTNTQSSVGNIGNPEGIPSLFSILFIWVIASLMRKFIAFMTNVAATLGGGLKASDMGKGLKEAIDSARGAAGKLAMEYGGGKEIKAALTSARDKLDDKLFDSGKNADDRRKKEKADNATKNSQKKTLKRAGDKAFNDYKNSAEGAMALGSMSKAEQKAKENEVRNKAHLEAGKAMDLSPEQTKAALDHVNKHIGNNIGMSLANSYRNRQERLRNERNAETPVSYSNSEMKALLREATPEQREKLQKSFDEGSLQLKGTTAGAALKAAAAAKNTSYAAMKAGAKASSKAAGAAASTAAKLATDKSYRQKTAKGISDSVSAGAAAVRAAPGAATTAATAAAGAAKSAAISAKNAAGNAATSAATAVSDTAKTAATAIGGSGEERKAAQARISNNIAAAGAAIGSAANSAGSGAVSAAKAAGSGAVSAVKAAEEAYQGKEATAARKLLEKAGKIDRMAPGTAWAASNKDKAAIADQVKLTKAETDTDFKKNDARALSNMRREIDYLNANDKISPDDNLTSQISQKAVALGKRLNPIGESKKNAILDSANAAHDATKNKIQNQIDELVGVTDKDGKTKQKGAIELNDDKIKDLQAKKAPIAEKIKKINDDKTNKINELKEKKPANKKEEKENKAAIKKLEKEKSPELKKLEEEKSEIDGDIHKAVATRSNLSGKLDKLQSAASAMDKAKAITNKAVATTTPKSKAAKAKSESETSGNENPVEINTTQRDENTTPELTPEAAEEQHNETPEVETASPTAEKIKTLAEAAAKTKADEVSRKAAPAGAQGVRNKAVSNVLSAALGLMGRGKEALAEKEEAKLKDLPSDVIEKSDQIVNNADEIIHSENPDKDSYEFKDAVKTREDFDNISSADDLKDFVKNAENKAEAKAEEFGQLKTPDDFKKFNEKYKPAKDNDAT